MGGLGIATASPGYNQPLPRLSHRGRALSLLSSLGSTQDLASSSSLRDIQVRAASSTKSRRKTQTLSNPSTSPVVSVRPHKSLGGPKTSDSHTNEPRESFVKRRAIYTGSMYLDSPATSDATCRDENHNVYPHVSVDSPPSGSSVLSQIENMHQSTRSPCGRPNKVHLGKDVPRRRAPLVSVDLNMQTKCKSSSAIHHASMPPSAYFVSRSSSFLSTDPFASATVHRRRQSESPETVYHPIVLDLLTALDLAIGEWTSV
ncbi:hypothetical protein PILCRDRAFT_424743 [Piloderma croceum F 1598]|uniref:Uncharacterized protein n=1 Tax=Piloderma croceum (strain F 1598) TaxID=765440 RepID=A0A0C3G0A3_PILCF|nr:hypothetical protein PILCRDRAFT_424743 [Piloderma croceum F 1598]